MLDIKFIRENKDVVAKAVKDKAIDLDLDKLLELDEKRRELIAQNDEWRAKRNEIAEKMKGSPKNRQELIEDGRKIKNEISVIETELAQVQNEYDGLMALVPNIPSADTPIGGEEDFRVVEEAGDKPEFDFKPKDHIELGRALDLFDLERGAKVSGFRGYYLKNEGVMLHLGILTLALRKMVEKGFTPVIPPTLVREFALFGSGHFPFAREEIYEVEEFSKDKEKEMKYLVGTAEPSLLAYHAGEILEEKNLPVKLVGFSPCYRREVGGYGQDTKGIYRIHEFMKVEQVVLTRNEISESDKWFEEMRGFAQEFLRELGLPHRVIQIATGDMGAGKYKMYDIETWMPARNAYGETHSCSNLTDWQSRRLNIRYKTRDGFEYVHALNNTVIASPRILIAILENNQQSDGSVKVPKVLQDFIGKEMIILK